LAVISPKVWTFWKKPNLLFGLRDFSSQTRTKQMPEFINPLYKLDNLISKGINTVYKAKGVKNNRLYVVKFYANILDKDKELNILKKLSNLLDHDDNPSIRDR
jgi:ferredoxin-fold anticodon binding domain-containing protein